MNLNTLSKRSDIILAVFLMAVIFIMILPLPTLIVDTFIAFNMCISIIMLMISIYMFTPLSFAAFPSVLLIATLFRLALSISTTRLIMLNADAGDIITTFGNFVVGGNLVVGIVVFTIITVVQFIVITKGSERVAEVAARFSLDGLPGKQMSIDGDLRAGSIDASEARLRRKKLQKESQLYGSLDGAMKFVKGDAIAGIVITIINIIGGISIGAIQQGMSFSEAGRIYTVLTIGDGLVNQIPALFIALASGIIVTRVTADDSANLGQDIGKQMFGNSKAMMMGAFAMLLFAMMPGFPSTIFLIFAFVAGGSGLLKTLKQKKKNLLSSKFINAAEEDEKQAEDPSMLNNMPFSAAISMDIDENLKAHLDQERLNIEFYDIRRNLNLDMGVTFPGVHLRYRRDFEPGQFTIRIHDIRIANGILNAIQLLADSSLITHASLNIANKPAKIDCLPSSYVWIDANNKSALLNANIPCFNVEEALIFSLSRVLRLNASEFIDTQEASDLTNQLKSECSDLVRELISVVSLQLIGQVLRILVSENVSIRNLRGISESILKHGKDNTQPNILAELVRSDLNRQISYQYANMERKIYGILLAEHSKDFIIQALRQTNGIHIALSEDKSQQFIQAIKNHLKAHRSKVKHTVLVVDHDLRPHLRKLLSNALPMLPVLSIQHISPEIILHPLEYIDINTTSEQKAVSNG